MLGTRLQLSDVESGDAVYLDYRNQGFPKTLELKTTLLSNLQFGLAKASALPFDSKSQDFLFHSFLFDRLDDPEKALMEMHRVLKVGGTMIFITPLNFLKVKHWKQYTPPIKIYEILLSMDFKILDWQDDFQLHEPIDLRGNGMQWKCLAVACIKKI